MWRFVVLVSNCCHITAIMWPNPFLQLALRGIQHVFYNHRLLSLHLRKPNICKCFKQMTPLPLLKKNIQWPY